MCNRSKDQANPNIPIIKRASSGISTSGDIIEMIHMIREAYRELITNQKNKYAKSIQIVCKPGAKRGKPITERFCDQDKPQQPTTARCQVEPPNLTLGLDQGESRLS
jgi:hypothetical protein